MEQSRGRQPRVLKIDLKHSKGSVSDRYLAYIGLRGSETAHCIEEHPLTLSLSLSKGEDGLGLGIYLECLLRLSLRLPYGGPQMETKVNKYNVLYQNTSNIQT